MLYTETEIKDVLWNIFTTYAKEIKFLEQIGEEFWYEVILEDEITVDDMNDIRSELDKSDLFDAMIR